MKHALLILCACALLAGCGSSSPTTPTPVPTPTPAPQPAPPPATPFQGVWIGTWTKTGCSETGGAVGVGCNSIPASGGLTVTLTQSGSTAQGTVLVGVYQMATSGPISASNQLALSGQGKQGGVTTNLASWSTSIASNLMVGSFAYVVAPDDVRLGTVTVQATLQSVVKQ